ncbi:SMI1/KNR4 family protein [Nonomuraea sp. NPDC059194]|uniref:SMI1/KNR4 family protein n=1 Tax=Nonomuraea sp. NPDC059194 TaxID=3346764 RepID=UPI0036AF1566
MVKLVRLALTAAILAAIAVRLRRRRAGVTREGRAEEAPRRRWWPRWMIAGVALGALATGSLALDAWVFGKPREQPRRWTPEATPVVIEPFSCADLDGICKTAIAIAIESLPPCPDEDGECFLSGVRKKEPLEFETSAPPSRPELLFEAITTDDASCHPERRPPAVRPVDPRVKRLVERQWRRIEGWLAANAPRSHSSLGRPARASTIALAESQMGLRFPDDLRASLLRHNGGLSLPSHHTTGIREIRDTWRSLCESDDFDDGGDPRGESWDGQMIPLGPVGLGGYLVLDSERGDLGRILKAESMYFGGEPWARSFHALLKHTADALESGGVVDGHRPTVISGELVWEYVG